MGKPQSKQVEYFRPRLISFDPPRETDSKEKLSVSQRFSLRVSSDPRDFFRDDQKLANERKEIPKKAMNKSSSVRTLNEPLFNKLATSEKEKKGGFSSEVRSSALTERMDKSVLLLAPSGNEELDDIKVEKRLFFSEIKPQGGANGGYFDPSFKITRTVPEKIIRDPEFLKYKPTGRKVVWGRRDSEKGEVKEMKRSSSFLLHRNQSLLMNESQYEIMKTSVEAINSGSPNKRSGSSFHNKTPTSQDSGKKPKLESGTIFEPNEEAKLIAKNSGIFRDDMGILRNINEEVHGSYVNSFSEGNFLNYKSDSEQCRKEIVLMGRNMIDKVFTANSSDFSEYERIYEDKKSELHLQIFMKTYALDSKTKINIFRSEFFMPCSAQEFLSFMNDVPLQRKLDGNVDQFYVAESLSQENKAIVLYLSYKKVLTASSREFVYYKVIEKVKDGVWCDSSRSIEFPDRFPETKERVRGNIILSGHMVEDLPQESKRCRVRLYSETDFKFSIPVFLSKTFSIKEMKAYTEKCYKTLLGEGTVS